MSDAVSDPEDFEHGEREAIDAGFVWLECQG